ncbi:tripartite ATP-independent transporter DctM subunit [Azospirillum lipoferum]|uniref:TRAP transporter large permease protein n=1 Tax=Azospirillum lipoferum TaxID=193 RepID=A0A5A9GQ47_AZOLI|nr:MULTISPECIES: TRAP transporter large permease [Azospirillum]KAA0595714.1 TRAP transporter large permease [Azospirillum lipoferum]MCP1611420.1 tripartite ATP-independent transporter DctM subunit [Azospirillum lipoferum]MDW5537222.1 TRAP transporter large permease [Azospirillum sp. NL1]
MVTALFVTFAVLLILGAPVGIALGGASAVYLVGSDIDLAVVPQFMYAGMDSFVLLCIPGFVLAGNLMNGGGITDQIVLFSNRLVGHIRGGLGLANVTGSMVFAGISGTAVAETASIGAVMIPAMRKSGYDAPFAAAVTAAASTVGPIIPPSVPMIIVGTLTGLSVGKMFMAGAVPGLLLGLGMMLTVWILARVRNYPREPWQGFGALLRASRGAFWALLMTAIILFGIVGGYFTPTEASIVSAIYAFVIGLFVYKGFKLRQLPAILLESAIGAGGLILLVGLANVFGWILTSEQIPQAIAASMLALTTNKYLIILLINILLLIVGTFMETIAALIILFPPLLAVATQVGIDPIHFATFAVLNLMIGLTTPPVGVCLFVAANIAKISLGAITKAIWPFLLCNILILFLVSYIPALSLWLPSLLFR